MVSTFLKDHFNLGVVFLRHVVHKFIQAFYPGMTQVSHSSGAEFHIFITREVGPPTDWGPSPRSPYFPHLFSNLHSLGEISFFFLDSPTHSLRKE